MMILIYPDWGFTAGPELLDKPHIPQNEYLQQNNRHRLEDWGVIVFLNHIYFPLLRKELNKEFFQEIVGNDYSNLETRFLRINIHI